MITQFFIGILTTYIALTNQLAGNVVDLLESSPNNNEPTLLAVEPYQPSDFLRELPSYLKTIPDLLQQNTTYQQAAISDSSVSSSAADPIEALVNILCTFQENNTIQTTTGTGFFIDDKGIIMTNAHVAQFLLLASTNEYGDASCVVRTGNPATPQYTASLLYIPPAWISENAKQRAAAVPMGTGERDYALLFIDGSTNETPLPDSFPSLSYNNNQTPLNVRGTSVTAAGYPTTAAWRSTGTLVPQAADTTISDLYTFGNQQVDVMAIRGSAVGSEGASGGPVVNERGDVIGMIVTRGDDSVDGPGSLRAITLSHIERTMVEETGFGLDKHLANNVALRSEIFTATITPLLLDLFQESE